jgi:ATP-binding protein involved in chromosome partitioning
LFSTLFSSKKPAKQGPEIIEQALVNYRSICFPHGVLDCALSFAVVEQQNGFNVALTMPFPCVSELQLIADSLSQSLQCEVVLLVSLAITPVRSHQLEGVKNIIAFASGKGGVGKSTTAVNVAYALMAEGAKVGVLDADIYGPSIPTLLGLQQQKPSSVDGKKLQPLDAHGLVAMSIGFLVPEQDATVWRGPMASTAFNQLLNETTWPELDYLIIDMPPGTGDIQLTLSQKVPVAGAVIITTPQDIALADARKGIAMFDKVQVPVLGIIENMSYYLCQHCGEQSALFGTGGGARIAQQYQSKLLGQLPLDVNIRADADNGLSGVVAEPKGDIAQLYRKIASTLGAELYYQLDSRSQATPDIIIEED